MKSKLFLVSSSDVFMQSMLYWFWSSPMREAWKMGNSNAGGVLEEEGTGSGSAGGIGDKGLETVSSVGNNESYLVCYLVCFLLFYFDCFVT